MPNPPNPTDSTITTAAAAAAILNAITPGVTPDGKPLKQATITMPDGTKITVPVAANPNYKPPPPTPNAPKPTKPDPVGNTFTAISTAIGFVAIAGKLASEGSKIAEIAASDFFSFLSMIVNTYVEFDAISDMFDHGFTWKDMSRVLGAFASRVFSLTSKGVPLTAALLEAGLELVIATAVAFVKWLIGRVHENNPSATDLTAADVSVWSFDPKSVMAITVGMALQGAGIHFVPNVPSYTIPPVAKISFQQKLVNSRLVNLQGDVDPNQFTNAAYFRANGHAPLYIYKAGVGDAPASGPDYVMVASSFDANRDQATLYTIRQGFKIAAPDKPYYLPMSLKNPNGPGNAMNMAMVQTSNALAAAAPFLAGNSGITSIQQAGASNKEGSVVP